MSWRWLRQDVVIAIHSEQIAQHGGGPGILDKGRLSSAMARPQNQVEYDDPSVFDLAAAQTFGIISNHPFVDGNKRTGFLAAYVFLVLNGWELDAAESHAVAAVLDLATGKIDEPTFSTWLKDHSVEV